MTDLPVQTICLLGLVGLVAGFVDAIAGGGGLLTVPALWLAGLDPIAALATNKLQSTFGSGAATLRFQRAGLLDTSHLPIALASSIGAVCGAFCVSFLPKETISLALPVILVLVALYFALSPKITDADRHPRVAWPLVLGLFVPLIGFYDGAFGPGTGSFFTAGFVGLSGLSVVKAIARTKLANFASNSASLVIFLIGGHVVWIVGLVMGLGQFIGAWAGTHAALGSGARLVKPLIIFMSVAMALRLSFAPGGAVQFFYSRLSGF